MNIKQILSLSPDERDLEIRKLVIPKPWKHELNCFDICKKCNVQYPSTHPSGCPVPDPIALDWNLAKAKQAECDSVKFGNAMLEICEFVYSRELDDIDDIAYVDGWTAYDAKEHHYLLAALKAKELKDEQNN